MTLTLNTVNDVFCHVGGRGQERVVLWQDASGAWHPITSNELYVRVRALAAEFQAWGIVKGDRIAILSENRWEWPVTDFAALAIGAVDVPLYPTLTAEQTAYALKDSGARIAVVSTKSQYAKVNSIRQQTAIERVIVMDGLHEGDGNSGPGTEHDIAFADLMEGAGEGRTLDPEFDALVDSVQPDDLATIIYTSGTTGESKGVMLTHRNIASNLNHSTTPFGFTRKDSCISFLPLSHITARHLDYAMFCRDATLAYCPTVDKLPKALLELKPTILVAVPRVYEKFRDTVKRKSAAASPLKQKIAAWALDVGKKNREKILSGKLPGSLSWKLADKLVFSKIRAAFGGHVGAAIAGGAPLGVDTASWFADASIRIFEGYGLTETSPVIALNYPQAYRMGSVGKALPNVECRFAEDGELEVRGPAIFIGYWNKPEQTAENFTEDGFFKTGDIGRMDEDGFIYITDRKKELIKTSNGKFIAPQPIENKLKAHTIIGQAALVGDKQKFISVLLSPNLATLREHAKAAGIDIADAAELVKDVRVQAMFEEAVSDVNGTLANFEFIKRTKVVPEEWSLETGELTPTLKLKRRVIVQKYGAEIAAFYGDGRSQGS